MKKRIYLVYHKGDGEDSQAILIRAANKAQATLHVTRSLFDCKVASQEDLVAMLASGFEIINAGTGADNGVENAKTGK